MAYNGAVRRIQIYIDEPLDDALEREAQCRGTSKAALIRRAVANEYPVARPALPEDGWAALDGMIDSGEPDADIDEVMYGPKR